MDKILLFPYWLSLKIRHFLYDKGIKKVHQADVPTICVGNVTVGGTGKTPHTEMLLRSMLADSDLGSKSIAVLSRGYKRKSKGFQQVVLDGSAKLFGDEPVQMKRKFPYVTVAVDKSRKEGCKFLCNPELLETSKKARKCLHKDVPKADLIILDDAFQHRSIKPTLSIVLVDYTRPIFKDYLLPLGRLRDLQERIKAADIIIVTKCPTYIDAWEEEQWAKALGVNSYNQASCCGERKDGKKQHVFFSTIRYDAPMAIFPEGDPRYVYAKRAILFTGIANDKPLREYLCGSYKIVKHFNFPDHHKFTKSDISSIDDAANAYPTSVVMTTEKDSQRIRDCVTVSSGLKLRMFQTPIKAEFISEGDRERFLSLVKGYLGRF